MGPAVTTLDEVIMEMMRLKKSLPRRPTLQELENALAEINKADRMLASRLEQLFMQERPERVCQPIFDALQEMRKDMLEEQASEQKLRAEAVIKLEERHRKYDNLIQKSYSALTDSPESLDSSYEDLDEKNQHKNIVIDQVIPIASIEQKTTVSVSRGANLPTADIQSTAKLQTLEKSTSSGRTEDLLAFTQSFSSIDKAVITSTCQNSSPLHSEDLNSFDGCVENSSNVLNMLEMAAQWKLKTLDLHGAFLKELEWVPDCIGKLSQLTELNLSGNRLTTLPESICELQNLTLLDVSANQLISLPESLGCLTSLRVLNIEKNKIEELPWTIGQCTALMDLNADFNKLKALPEAVGTLGQLRHLSVHLNSLKSLPTTMAAMTSLMELDVHFNQLESIPESLCLVTTLTTLNVGSNFTDLKELPQSIGRLQKLKVLDASYNHLTVLPDSFALLTNLQELRLEGNPLRVPPIYVAEQGKEAVLQYMNEYITQKENERNKVKKRGKLARLLSSIFKSISARRKTSNDILDIRA